MTAFISRTVGDVVAEMLMTRSAFAGGYLRTGDIGYVADGEVYVCGRSKEVVIVNGRNYYPQDIEWEASQVEGIRKGNVIAFGTMTGTGDRERVVVIVTSRTGFAPLKPQQLGKVNCQISNNFAVKLEAVHNQFPFTGD